MKASENQIRATWARVREEAMKAFENNTTNFAAEIIPHTPFWEREPGESIPAEVFSHSIVFVHMTDNSGTLRMAAMIGAEMFRRDMTGHAMSLEGAVKITDAYEEPIPYRVVCEGLVVEEGEYPVRLHR